jgi:integral membrane sensor domain MASE1
MIGLSASLYWLGDSTGVLLVTPLVFTLPSLFAIRSWARIVKFAALLALLTLACVIVFGDLQLIPVRLHVLAFAVLPCVMWAVISRSKLNRGMAPGSTLVHRFIQEARWPDEPSVND